MEPAIVTAPKIRKKRVKRVNWVYVPVWQGKDPEAEAQPLAGGKDAFAEETNAMIADVPEE